ncbi:MAG: Obg family GTPase CgtA, partial [Terriglobales bacterium]
LKVLADVGIIGLPNAGKSTLLSVVSAAKPKIADYPFSTLEPNLGVVRTPDGDNSFVVADIPGLVEGASNGVGLGHDFLRHVERTRLLVHLVDITSEKLAHDIETIDNELKQYSGHLAALPQFLVLNKADTLLEEESEQIANEIRASKAAQGHSPPMVISAATNTGVKDLLHQISALLIELKAGDSEDLQSDEVAPDARATDHADSGFEVVRKKGTFTVLGDRVARVVSVTNMRDPDSLHHLHNVLRSMGVIDALIKQGAKAGSEVVIGDVAFVFGEEWGG